MNKTIFNIFLITFFSILSVFPISAIALDDSSLESVYDLRGRWKFSIGDNEEWSSPDYDDSGWDRIFAPGGWENEGFYGYDGFAWYRTAIEGSDIEFSQELFLMLGYIDDTDEVFVNGHLIGRSGRFPPRYSTAYNARRLYYVPTEILKRTGKNVIAIRVFDEGGEGGIIKGRIGLYERVNEFRTLVNLQGIWKFKPGDDNKWKGKYWNDKEWESIITPSYWRNVGLWRLDGKAWYRKTFFLDKKYKGEDLYVILGKIDDFDRTYINGEFIGETNDHRRFRHSTSYDKVRIYKLPVESLLFNGYNTIAVQVEDIGERGGICEGPLGIVNRRQLQRIKYHDNDW